MNWIQISILSILLLLHYYEGKQKPNNIEVRRLIKNIDKKLLELDWSPRTMKNVRVIDSLNKERNNLIKLL